MAPRVPQIIGWTDAVQFAGTDQCGQARPGVAALAMSGEEGVLAVQGEAADGVFDGVGSISARPSIRKIYSPSQWRWM